MCLKLGVPTTGAKPDGTPYYTPNIYDPNTDTAVTDALPIMPLVALSLHQFALRLFPTDQEYFLTSRALIFGAKLDEMAPTKEAREEQWARLEQGLAKVVAWMEANALTGRVQSLSVVMRSCMRTSQLRGGALRWSVR